MNTKERYCQILGIEYLPNSPENLPKRIYLPAESLGDFEMAILETSAKGTEYLQTIYWSKNKFVKSRLYRGDHWDVGDGGIVGLLREFFGVKPFISFHTHTTDNQERMSYEPSSHDIAQFRAYPRDSFIDICGSGQGVMALLQTRVSAKLPFSSILEKRRVEQKLDELDFEILSQPKQARILKKLGYGYYVWTPTRKRIMRGDLNKGIQLRRI